MNDSLILAAVMLMGGCGAVSTLALVAVAAIFWRLANQPTRLAVRAQECSRYDVVTRQVHFEDEDKTISRMMRHGWRYMTTRYVGVRAQIKFYRCANA